MLRLLVIAALLAPGAALAADKDQKKERRICKREAATGSFVQPKRTCLTKEEWDRARAYNRRTVDEWQNTIDGKRTNG